MAEYIDREALRKILENWRDAHVDVDDEQGCGLLEDVIWEVDAQPAADVAPVMHGWWTETDWVEMESGGHELIKTPKAALRCSNCRNCFKKELLWKSNFCPNCGAKMTEEIVDG